jgi:ATP-dependent exoDNAse (exonuclease V) beta subunit
LAKYRENLKWVSQWRSQEETEKRDKALLYVAMTRAKMLLYISGNGSKSSILQKTYPYKLID